ncbi:hypothetical protein QT621_19225 [Xanthomonas citri pv. citri]|uniref:Uncharacterized protein n=1 Tax=Xanthomonas citri pv. citri TaxID=611301 RepID=A0A0U5BZM4_XANCI|nr:hypothetical protein XAC29_02580 [Xanthomonas axonopodis Xac29-1]AKM23761.1 hypothetical protein AB890_02630 [Xanthomonas citri pv. citri]APR12466.1 hypothetical protein BI314_22200 [Xanthomonas citri pv. citri]APR25131.1 hypothetical protein BJD09_13880 [Xanthomonas citri pv. citri]ARR14773.1 hypothetical protein B7L66_23235 [Xanthomonas citri pv. citri]
MSRIAAAGCAGSDGHAAAFARGAGVERQVRWREQISGTAQRHSPLPLPTRRSPLAARRSRQTSHEGHPAIVSAHGRITAAHGAR